MNEITFTEGSDIYTFEYSYNERGLPIIKKVWTQLQDLNRKVVTVDITGLFVQYMAEKMMPKIQEQIAETDKLRTLKIN